MKKKRLNKLKMLLGRFSVTHIFITTKVARNGNTSSGMARCVDCWSSCLLFQSPTPNPSTPTPTPVRTLADRLALSFLLNTAMEGATVKRKGDKNNYFTVLIIY